MTRASYAIVSSDRRFAWMLGLALRLLALRERIYRREAIGLARVARNKADILIYAFEARSFDDLEFLDRQVAAMMRDPAKVKIVMQLASAAIHGAARSEIDRKNSMIETIARRSAASTIATAEIMRSGAKARLAKSGRPNFLGYASLANAVLRAIRVRSIRSAVTTGPSASKRIPSVRAQAVLPDVDEALAALSWKSPALPEILTSAYARETVIDFADGMVFFPSFRSWGKFPLGNPVDWGMAGANWSWQSYFTGLEFLRPPMVFWYDFAGHGESEGNSETLKELQRRGKTPADLMRRASFLLADFVRNNPPTQPKNQRAYFQGTICRRLKALTTYLVCAKKAAELGTPLDRDEVALAFAALSDSFEMLKRDEIYPAAGNHGVRQDVLFIAAGLLLQALPYGRELLDLGMERLKRQQLDHGLSPDGVWLENSFGYHCLIMNQLTATAHDLRTAGAPGLDVLHNALTRMEVFAEALIKVDGFAPLIGDTAPGRHFSTIAGAVAELARHEPGGAPEPVTLQRFRRSKDTYLFDAGYFVSHTSREVDPASSSLIFFSNLSRPKHKQADDLSIVFSHGATDLLIDGGTYNKEISDTVRNAARHDPATHNTFRVNGAGYPMRAPKGQKPAGLSGMWQREGWAAARGFNTAYAGGSIVRFVIHLKRHHAVIVLDQLIAGTRAPALFEQFWHIAPDFTPGPAPSSLAGPWLFTSPDKGTLIGAFDSDPAECAVEFGGPDNPIAFLMLPDERIVPTPYMRRSRSLRSLRDGTMASLFQWSERPGAAEIGYAPRGKTETEITARGVGFTARFVVGENKVEYLALE